MSEFVSASSEQIYGTGEYLTQAYRQIEKLHNINGLLAHLVEAIDTTDDEHAFNYYSDIYDQAYGDGLETTDAARFYLINASRQTISYPEVTPYDGRSVFIAFATFLKAYDPALEFIADNLTLAVTSLLPGVPVITDVDRRPNPAIVFSSPEIEIRHLGDNEKQHLYDEYEFVGKHRYLDNVNDIDLGDDIENYGAAISKKSDLDLSFSGSLLIKNFKGQVKPYKFDYTRLSSMEVGSEAINSYLESLQQPESCTAHILMARSLGRRLALMYRPDFISDCLTGEISVKV